MTAERSQSEGKVIITTLSQGAFGAAENAEVTVDGEAAAKASSYSELRSATEGGEQSWYLVRQQSSAEASGEVLVAVNHFSERSVAVTSGDDSSGNSSTEPATPGAETTSPASACWSRSRPSPPRCSSGVACKPNEGSEVARPSCRAPEWIYLGPAWHRTCT